VSIDQRTVAPVKEPPQDDNPLSPQSYPLATVASLWENLPQVAAAGILFSLASAPAFVLAVVDLLWPALIAAIAGVMPGWVTLLWFEARRLDGRADGIAAILPAFRRLWLRSVRLGIAGFGVPVVGVVAAAWFGMAVPSLAWLSTAALLPAILVFGVATLYAAPLLAIHDTDTGTALRNAAILSARHPANTLGLIAMAVLMAMVTIYVSLGFLFVLPAVYGMFVANNCRLVVTLEDQP
jgi:uncharacterized membrane protein YesL